MLSGFNLPHMHVGLQYTRYRIQDKRLCSCHATMLVVIFRHSAVALNVWCRRVEGGDWGLRGIEKVMKETSYSNKSIKISK